MNRPACAPDVMKAMVSMMGTGGQGVLITGGVILTAAHCIELTCKGPMALESNPPEAVRTRMGRLNTATIAVEPVSDLAVLGPTDDQKSPKDAEKFREFVANTEPVALYVKKLEEDETVPVYIFTHERTVVRGVATDYAGNSHRLWVVADEPIVGGTSGGPIVTSACELVGVASNFSTVTTGDGSSDGFISRPHLALPLWVCCEYFGMTAGTFSRRRIRR